MPCLPPPFPVGSRLLNLINDILDCAAMRHVRSSLSLPQPFLTAPLCPVLGGQVEMLGWRIKSQHSGSLIWSAPSFLVHLSVPNISVHCALKRKYHAFSLLSPFSPVALQKSSPFTVKHEQVYLEQIVDDVLYLCQPLARKGVKLVNAGG